MIFRKIINLGTRQGCVLLSELRVSFIINKCMYYQLQNENENIRRKVLINRFILSFNVQSKTKSEEELNKRWPFNV